MSAGFLKPGSKGFNMCAWLAAGSCMYAYHQWRNSENGKELTKNDIDEFNKTQKIKVRNEFLKNSEKSGSVDKQ